MDMPKQIKIGSHIFDVLHPFDFKDDGNTLGRCCFTATEIQIAEVYDTDSRKVPDSRKRVTLLREVLHAALDVCGKDEESNNEPLVEALAETLTTIFRENPALVRCLMEGVDDEKDRSAYISIPGPVTAAWPPASPSWDVPSLATATNTASHAGFISREEAK